MPGLWGRLARDCAATVVLPYELTCQHMFEGPYSAGFRACCVDHRGVRGPRFLNWTAVPRRSTSLRGCDRGDWDKVLFLVKLWGKSCSDYFFQSLGRVSGGYLHAVFSSPEFNQWWFMRGEDMEGRSCKLGRFFLRYCGFMSLGDGGPSHAKYGQGVFNETLRRLGELDSDRHLGEDLFFELTGVTRALLRYNLLGTASWYAQPQARLLPTPTKLGLGPFTPGRKPVVFDFGVGGGLDALVQMLRGAVVLGVEALPSAFARLRDCLQPQFPEQLHLLHAAVVPQATREEDLRAGRNSSVRFFEKRDRKDRSSLTREVGAGDLKDFKEHHVPSVSCLELLRRFGTPDVLKIDLEGGDAACVADLVAAGAERPRLVVVELPSSLEEAAGLLESLSDWGYRRCKLSRQSDYQVRCWPGKLDCHQALQHDGIARFTGTAAPAGAPRRCARWSSECSMTMVGLLGDAAVDFLAGLHWHDIDRCRSLLRHPVPVYQGSIVNDMFDLHVTL